MTLVKSICDDILKKQNKKLVTLVGIDGPTASGKTTLANNLKKELESQGENCWIYRLDWTLKERKEREKDLENLNKSKYSFPYEAELHMNLRKVQSFLESVALFNQSSSSKKKLLLLSLYSRENNGTLSGKEEVHLEPGMIIILEGHYTLRNELARYIDYNILLIGEMEEFLRRKVNRVKGYRSTDIAKNYFWKIDIPSFKNHLNRFGINANLIIDNTNYNQPTIKKKEYIEYWLKLENKNIIPQIKVSKINLSSFIFSDSTLIPSKIKKYTENVISMLKEWDLSVDKYLRTNISSLNLDLTEIANTLVDKLNKESNKEYSFKIMHTDTLYNVYNRILPISLAIGLFYKNAQIPEVSIIAEVFHSELSLQIIWVGNYKRISFIRELGKITKNRNYEIKDTTGELIHTNETIDVMTPTNFTIPSFLRDFNYKLIYIKKEDEVISASQALSRLIHDGGVWIHRFALFSELRFYQDILRKTGVHSVQAGNYLISVKHKNSDLQNKFKLFIREWEKPLSKRLLFKESEAAIDKIIIEERNKIKQFVKPLKHFHLMDGYIFSRFMYEDEEGIQEAIIELRKMMTSEERLLRKRSFDFLLKFFPNIHLRTSALWSDLPRNSINEISLGNYLKLNPSIMAEVYLWMALRDERSAILATNIYDIRRESFDAISYLESAAENQTPLVLQSSLNAIGQEEIDEEGHRQIGYLKLSNGPIQFISSVMRSARNLYLTKGILPPLFGIGLDHVAVDYDIPKGRAQRFFKRAYKTGKLTHYVQDGSSLFNAKTRDKASLIAAYKKMIDFSTSLLDNLEKTYLIDREVCAGELNYVEDSKQSIIPTAEEMKLFMEIYQQSLKKRGYSALISRPTLFIGNLGTTHHGYDQMKPKVEYAKIWRNYLKNENFISPVLHGTSNSHRDVLANASEGCHKINVAGDLLDVFIANLPEKISRIISDSNVEPKKMIASVRFLIDELNEKEQDRLKDALKRISNDLIRTINAPKLSKMDSNYFNYNTFSFPEEHINLILKSVLESIEKYRISKQEIKVRDLEFSASMIEVPEEDMFKLTDVLWKKGIRNFHIDAGDGEFITRNFSGIKKARFLKEKYPKAELHAHLMIKNPHFPYNGELSAIQQYAEAGCDAIAIHPRSFDNERDLINALKLIKNLGKRPGILIETHDSIGENIEKIIDEADLDWIVIMGVPIGYGGQMFQFTTLQTISDAYEFFKRKNKKALIEVDGGLTLQTLKLCKNAGAELFAGWSIIKGNTEQEISKKIEEINKILKNGK